VVEKVATQASSRSKPAASINSIGCRQAFRRAHGQWKIFPSNDWSSDMSDERKVLPRPLLRVIAALIIWWLKLRLWRAGYSFAQIERKIGWHMKQRCAMALSNGKSYHRDELGEQL
jgi:hypothetical protein